MEEIINNNKLIAEFDNYDQVPEGIKVEFWRYNNSWDWLMPVVEKIESLNLKEWGYKWESHDGEIEYNNGSICVEIERNRCWIYMNLQLDPFHTFNEQTRGIDFPTKLEATYQAVVEFIKWYNVQKETNSQNS